MSSFARSHPRSKSSCTSATHFALLPVDATGDTWDLSPDTRLDRDTLFLKSYSRVLRVSPPMNSRALYANPFFSSMICHGIPRFSCLTFSSTPRRKQITYVTFPVRRGPRSGCRGCFSLFPFPDPSGHVRPIIQAPVFAKEFGRTSAPTKRCVWLCTATIS